jgi:uncharacterized protein with GYD domain
MATFITMVKFTETGVQGIRETTKRAAAFKTAAKKMGVKVIGTYWTLGKFDGLMVFSAPDPETGTAAMLRLASEGNVTTTTVRAFEAAEMEKIVGLM